DDAAHPRHQLGGERADDGLDRHREERGEGRADDRRDERGRRAGFLRRQPARGPCLEAAWRGGQIQDRKGELMAAEKGGAVTGAQGNVIYCAFGDAVDAGRGEVSLKEPLAGIRAAIAEINGAVTETLTVHAEASAREQDVAQLLLKALDSMDIVA